MKSCACTWPKHGHTRGVNVHMQGEMCASRFTPHAQSSVRLLALVSKLKTYAVKTCIGLGLDRILKSFKGMEPGALNIVRNHF